MDIKLSIPLKYRRGSLRKDEKKSLESAIKLLDWVRKYKKIEGSRILDLGCGVKVTQALYQLGSPQELYHGTDVSKPIIEYLSDLLQDDPKYRFYWAPFKNNMYEFEDTQKMTPDSTIGADGEKFDIQLMFSVITHMPPEDTLSALAILRRHIKPDGQIFFWGFASKDQKDLFVDFHPDRPLLRAKYNKDYLEHLIDEAGWSIDCSVPTGSYEHPKISYVCSPKTLL